MGNVIGSSFADPAQQAATAAQDSASARQLRQHLQIKKAAQEFESQLLSAVWKSMQGSLDSEDDSTDAAAGNVQDLQVQALCSGMAAGGGIGIAKMIIKHMDAAEAASKKAAAQQNQAVSGSNGAPGQV